MKRLLLLFLNVVFLSSALADVTITTDRAVVGQNDKLTASLHFPAPDQGDLYVAVQIQGQLLFYGEDSGFHPEPVPYRRNGLYTRDQKILEIPGAEVPKGHYILYALVIDAGADVRDTNRWHGAVARQLFIANEPPQQSHDFNGDGWADDDADHDGFSDMDHDFDGWADNDADHNGISDSQEDAGQGGDGNSQSTSDECCIGE